MIEKIEQKMLDVPVRARLLGAKEWLLGLRVRRLTFDGGLMNSAGTIWLESGVMGLRRGA